MLIYNCRLCNGKLGKPKLRLSSTPLANEFIKTTEPQDTFPLNVCCCKKCGHYQLDESIEPERLFKNYLYVAGTSPVNVEHFKQYALHMIEKFDIKQNSYILDIASNDGTLLKHFKNFGMRTLGIDPAQNIAAEANKIGIETIPEFFTEEFANKILEKYGQFDLITANNVFAHVPDLKDFTKGIYKLLSLNGIFSFEVSYFMDVCDKTLIDTIYHEHSSYHTLAPLRYFFANLNMDIIDVDRLDNHGGSIRVYVANCGGSLHCKNGKIKLQQLVRHEVDIDKKVFLLQNNIVDLKNKLITLLQEIKNNNKSIAIYGVPAKATTLMYALNIDKKLIDFAVDDAELKQGLFTPGKHIPIYHPNELYKRKPDYILVLAWNFAESIINKYKDLDCKWIVPLPKLREYK